MKIDHPGPNLSHRAPLCQKRFQLTKAFQIPLYQAICWIICIVYIQIHDKKITLSNILINSSYINVLKGEAGVKVFACNRGKCSLIGFVYYKSVSILAFS